MWGGGLFLPRTMKKKNTLEYPMSTLSAPVKPNDIVQYKTKQRTITEHYVNEQYERLKEQAEVIQRQFLHLQERAELASIIDEALFNFEPICKQTYFLYQHKETHRLSLIDPTTWNNCPWSFVGAVVQLADGTWDWLPAET